MSLEFAKKLISVSRSTIEERLIKGFTISGKADKSLVTEVDIEIEDVWREQISKRFPDHGIIGEERGVSNQNAKYKWVLDPIDGTLSFTRGIPLYGSLIALLENDKPVLGIIDNPGINRCCFAEKGSGAFLNEAQLQIGDGDDFQSEVIARSDRANFIRSNLEGWQTELDKLHPRVRAYADCFGHSLACSGDVGAMVDINVCLWDIAATQIIIQEAGGEFELIEQRDDGRYSFIAGKRRSVQELSNHFNNWKSAQSR